MYKHTQLNIIGEEKTSTILDGSGSGTVVFILSDGSNVSGFTIQNGEYGIQLDSVKNCQISNNNEIHNEYYGIHLYASNNITITGNNAHSNNGTGISIHDSSDNIITDNNAHSNNDDGILIIEHARNNIVTSNNASNNFNGIGLAGSNTNTVTGNNVNSNSNYGIYLAYSTSNTLTSNYVSNNNHGIYLLSSNSNVIYNNFFRNTNNFYDDGNNIWNISKTPGRNIIDRPYVGGNYWTDYTGEDTDGDELGDTKVPHGPGDYLPLAYSFPHAPFVLLLHPIDGEILSNTVTITWYAYDKEDGSNLPIYFYYSTDEGDTWSVSTSNPQENTGNYTWDTTKLPDGTYILMVVAHDSDGNIRADSSNFQIKNHEEPQENLAANKPNKPSGLTQGKAGVEYTYTSSTTDPEGNQVYYLWDWGDGNNSRWLGPYNSGTTCEAKYTWDTKDTYNIKVKAKDIYGKESGWSDPLSVMMPYSFNNPLLKFFDVLFQRFPSAFPI